MTNPIVIGTLLRYKRGPVDIPMFRLVIAQTSDGGIEALALNVTGRWTKRFYTAPDVREILANGYWDITP